MYKTILSLSFIVATRFFGLFIVLPIFGLYASNLEHSTTILAGVAIGIYALMQVIFQIPFGLISDKFGRKNTMAFGLIIFIIGSLICGFSNDIYLMILGRAIQGSGAIGAVGIAMISDFTKEEDRGKAMAIMGIMIGLSFALSMAISPILANKFGLGMLFHISTILSVLCIFLLYMVVPKDIKIKSLSQNLSLKEIISDKDLAIMNLTNFLQKMFMTMAFFITPIVLVRALKFNEDSLWIVYVLAMIFGLIAMGLAGFLGEKKGFAKNILIFGVLFFMVSYLFFAISSNQYAFITGVILFFIGFNMHEPIMQSVASKFAKASQKGTVLGIFNSAGYFGSFIGGLLGGIMLENLGVKELSSAVFIISIIWLLLLITLTNPNIFKNIYFEKEFDFSRLIDVKGFIECYKKNSGFVVKYNSKLIKEDKILDILGVKDGKI
ncbi:MFS transporter [Campylobacter sp. FMV-PI01]|uniref:MFS transporter n=1 Tax=Campylobacter portucalensis TaxID=2608384 RepID=A0A6L5WI71_9BACT|nr:MFS transporter [Campylobacter portucalensis]MSN95947.1 MFS transporter [Campylobacter portucalensis]